MTDAGEREIAITTDMIRLGQLLKLAGMVGGGGEVKGLLATGDVRVNGEPEMRRGRQLAAGDLIDADGERLRLVAAPSP